MSESGNHFWLPYATGSINNSVSGLAYGFVANGLFTMSEKWRFVVIYCYLYLNHVIFISESFYFYNTKGSNIDRGPGTVLSAMWWFPSVRHSCANGSSLSHTKRNPIRDQTDNYTVGSVRPTYERTRLQS